MGRVARVGQVGEYLDGGACGVLVAPGSAGALARGVLGLLRNRAAAEMLGSRAQQRAWQEYSWDRLAVVAEGAYRRARIH